MLHKLSSFRLLTITVFMFLANLSCKDGGVKLRDWSSVINDEQIQIRFENISKEVYESDRPIQALRADFPFFFSENKSDSVYESIRKDSLLKSIYQSQKEVFGSYDKLIDEVSLVFTRLRSFYPDWHVPEVYVYSSDLSSLYDPILYLPKENKLYIALDAFLGSDNEWYEKTRVNSYYLDVMTATHVLPKVVDAIGSEIIPKGESNTFLSKMVFEGKVLLLKDALLNKWADSTKIGYTSKEYAWSYKNEYYIWNFFLQSDLLYSSDIELDRRFLSEGPYSKFYNEAQTQSPSRIGRWLGWQILRKYAYDQNQLSLKEILDNTDYKQLFLKH